MSELLVPIRSKLIRSNQFNESRAVEAPPEQPKDQSERIKSADQAAERLRCQPKQETLIDVLKWLQPCNKSTSGFDIQRQSSLASQILHLLVNDVLPDHWSSIFEGSTKETRKARNLVISVLCNVGGISAMTTRLKVLIEQNEITDNARLTQQQGQADLLKNALSLLELVLEQESCILRVWLSMSASEPNATRRRLLWKELVALLGNGRVLSLASEANDIVAKASSSIREASWLAEGIRYSLWVGKNLVHMLETVKDWKEIDTEARKAWVQMLERALTLGHVGQELLFCVCRRLLTTRQIQSYNRFLNVQSEFLTNCLNFFKYTSWRSKALLKRRSFTLYFISSPKRQHRIRLQARLQIRPLLPLQHYFVLLRKWMRNLQIFCSNGFPATDSYKIFLYVEQ